MANTGKLLIVGATAVIAMLIVANLDGASRAREFTVSQQSAKYERPAAFETNQIYRSDASISTYGLDTGHNTDW
jgi:hypothetical protein